MGRDNLVVLGHKLVNLRAALLGREATMLV